MKSENDETEEKEVKPQNRKQRKAKASAYIRAKKNQRDKSIYTLGGEIFSSITHGLGALMGAVVLVVCVIVAALHGRGAIAIVSVCIFGAVAFIGFTISSVYHALGINTGKRVMRVLDYCSIYFIIAGTYTPFALIGLGGVWGWVIFGINWVLCAVGTTLTAVNREKYKKFAFICYLCMGWMVLIFIVPLVNAIGLGISFWLLLAGGIAYTLGAAVFKMKGKYIHGVWHLFTMAGLVLHFFSILYLLV